jgi:hypothetical protein
MDRRTVIAIARYRTLMENVPNQEFNPYDVTSYDERNAAWENSTHILQTLRRVVRQAEDVLAEENEVWKLVQDMVSDELLNKILDPNMLDEEALREVEVYVRTHF